MAIKENHPANDRGAGAGPTGTVAAGPMLEAKLMNLIKGWLQKFWLSNNFSVKFTHSRTPAASPDQSWYASDATEWEREMLCLEDPNCALPLYLSKQRWGTLLPMLLGHPRIHFLWSIFGTFVYSVTYGNSRAFSTKYGMVNVCANNGSFVIHFWHIRVLSYLWERMCLFNQIWHRTVFNHFWVPRKLSAQMCQKLQININGGAVLLE